MSYEAEEGTSHECKEIRGGDGSGVYNGYAMVEGADYPGRGEKGDRRDPGGQSMGNPERGDGYEARLDAEGRQEKKTEELREWKRELAAISEEREKRSAEIKRRDALIDAFIESLGPEPESDDLPTPPDPRIEWNPFDAPSLRLAEKLNLPSICAVYFLLNRPQVNVLYIGSTINLRQRWANHNVIWSRRSDFDWLAQLEIAWFEEPDYDLIHSLERQLIKRLQPMLNVHGKGSEL